ncbi:hypothetical protein HKD37_08G022810 [Glycine soja]
MDKATLSVPRPTPTIEQIKQDNSDKVEITFNRINSFSSRIEASRSKYESAKRSFSVRTRSVPVGLTRSESHNQFPTILLLVYLEQLTTKNRRTTKSRSNPQLTLRWNLMMLSDNFSIDKETLRKEFYSLENEPQRRWVFQHYKGANRKQIQDKFYEFVERVKINVLFFDWFHAYTIRKDIYYPWKQDIIGDPTTIDGELIQSELPPATQYQLSNVKDSNNKLVMAVSFKTKDVNEEVTSKDIKSLMEQENYTNKYLQVLGETIKTKVASKQKSVEEALPSIPIEKPLFKPFKVSDKAKRKIRELRKTKSLIEGVGDNHSELLNKIGSLLKVIPKTPQTSENTSKMVTRSTSKLINVINEDSDQNSEDATEIGSSFSANNIYEWNIDAQTEYNIMNTLQHMTMVATTYQTSHELAEFSGQLKVKIDLNGKVITNDEDKEIPDAVNTLIFTIAQHFIGDPSLWKDRSAELLSNLKCRTLADFRWYRDTFLTRVYTREDSQQPFWKGKFLASLPRSLGDKVRDKIRSQSANGDIPYESLSYGSLKICQDDKIQRQLAKEKAQTKKDLGSFCEQFGLSACPKQKKKQASRRKIHESKPKKLRNLNLEPDNEEHINNLLIETSEEETETSSSEPSDENLNIIQQDDRLSSTNDDGQINTLTKDEDLLFEAINSIPNPQEKKVFLEKLKKTLEVKPKQKDFITNNKLDAFKIVETNASDIGYDALPEPIIKKTTSSFSGSPTQTESSTQKTKIEGSLTQIATIKPESSIQDSPKPTVVDYTWSIQTLQALEDIGLTKIPKLAKKTWAEMASESDDDSETDLHKQIQKTKQTKTVCNPKEKQTMVQQNPTPKPTNSYIPKNKFFNVLQIEPEYWDKNPFKATAKVFPQGFHYRPTTLNKTRKFYEFILVDTNSVSIKHFKDSKDPSLNTHSTIQILKVMQPRHYESNLNQPKKFSAPFDPAGYT